MIDYIVGNLWIMWAVIMLGCLILELSSGDFFITCLAIGALVATGASFVFPFWAQILIWAVCSILSIWLIRPKLLRIGTVIEPILAGESGYVKVDGDEWKAVSNVPETIEKGSKVEIIARDSIIVTVKLI